MVHQAMAAWEEQKMEIVKIEVVRIREANQMLNEFLTSLNLPAALEVWCELLPQSIKDKARDVRHFGGIDTLLGMIDHSSLPHIKNILAEAERLLTEAKDKERKRKRNSADQLIAKDRCYQQTLTVELTKLFAAKLAQCRQALIKASNVNSNAEETIENEREDIELLSRPEEDLETAFRSASQSDKSLEAAAQLRLLMGQVNNLRSEREVLQHEIESATIDIEQETFLSTPTQDGAINVPTLSDKLGQVYGPLKERIQQSIEFQTSLIRQIEDQNEDFVEDREQLSYNLLSSYGTYMEQKNNLEKEPKFYNDLILKSKELLKDLKASLAYDVNQQITSNREMLSENLLDLFENAEFSDVTFNVGGHHIKSHKIILAARSPVFAAMFSHPSKENLTGFVDVVDVEPEVFKELLRYIYTGEVPYFSQMNEIVVRLLGAANKYLLEQLKKTCENHLVNRMSPLNCVQLLSLGENDPAYYLRQKAIEYIYQFPAKVTETDEWKKAIEEKQQWVLDIKEMLLELFIRDRK